jgi:hypothetical protein
LKKEFNAEAQRGRGAESQRREEETKRGREEGKERYRAKSSLLPSAPLPLCVSALKPSLR